MPKSRVGKPRLTYILKALFKTDGSLETKLLSIKVASTLALRTVYEICRSNFRLLLSNMMPRSRVIVLQSGWTPKIVSLNWNAVTHLRLVYNRPIDVLIRQLWGLIPSQSDTVYVQYYRLERTDNYSITIPYAQYAHDNQKLCGVSILVALCSIFWGICPLPCRIDANGGHGVVAQGISPCWKN